MPFHKETARKAFEFFDRHVRPSGRRKAREARAAEKGTKPLRPGVNTASQLRKIRQAEQFATRRRPGQP